MALLDLRYTPPTRNNNEEGYSMDTDNPQNNDQNPNTATGEQMATVIAPTEAVVSFDNKVVNFSDNVSRKGLSPSADNTDTSATEVDSSQESATDFSSPDNQTQLANAISVAIFLTGCALSTGYDELLDSLEKI